MTSVLITCDPMIMGEPVLRRYLEPLLDLALEQLESIRICTKSLAYWPQRFVSDRDATNGRTDAPPVGTQPRGQGRGNGRRRPSLPCWPW